MKKLFFFLVLGFSFIAAKAQTNPKIFIEYDNNGHRILRYYVPNRPAPPSQTDTLNKKVIAAEKTNTPTDGDALVALTQEGIKVFPNPSNDNFNIVVSEGILQDNVDLVLIDQLGREHKRQKIKSLTTTISTNGMADGVYSIIIQYGNNKETIKIVKVAK